MTQTFNEWLRRHPCSTEELWKIQNCLGSILDYNHPLAEQAQKAWSASKYPKDGSIECGQCSREWFGPDAVKELDNHYTEDGKCKTDGGDEDEEECICPTDYYSPFCHIHGKLVTEDKPSEKCEECSKLGVYGYCMHKAARESDTEEKPVEKCDKCGGKSDSFSWLYHIHTCQYEPECDSYTKQEVDERLKAILDFMFNDLWSWFYEDLKSWEAGKEKIQDIRSRFKL